MKRMTIIPVLLIFLFMVACSKQSVKQSDITNDNQMAETIDNENLLGLKGPEAIWTDEEIKEAEEIAREYMLGHYKEVELPLHLTSRDDSYYKYINLSEERYIVFDTIGIKGNAKAKLYISLERVDEKWIYVSSGH